MATARSTAEQASDHASDPLPCFFRGMTPSILQHEPRRIPAATATGIEQPRGLAFDRRAHSYAAAATVQRHLIDWLGEWVEQPRHANSKTALEVGAGNGLFTELLATRYERLTALDIAPRMVEHGRHRLPQVAWRTADAWQLGNAAQLPPRPSAPLNELGPVDRLFSASLLHWCEHPVEVLHRWRKLLRPAGRMLHAFYIAPTLPEWHSVVGGYSPVRWRTESQWLDIFREAGWHVLRSGTRAHVERFASAIELLRFLHLTGAIVPHRVPVGQLRRWINDYDHKFGHPQNQTGIPSTWTFLRIELGLIR